MALRIHFTAEDLARTRLASGPRPLVELDIGIRLLQERSHPVHFDAWRDRAARQLRPRFRPLFELIPPTGAGVEFLSLVGEGSTADLVEQLRSTPIERVRKDLQEWARQGAARLSPDTYRASQEPLFVQQLAALVEEAHERFIAPYWPQIDRLAHADRALRLRHLSEQGVERLLRELNPRRIIWKPPVLHVTMASGRSGDVYLDGRGLLLIPTLFGSHYPALCDRAEPQPWITFPIRSDHRLSAEPASVTAAALAEPSQSLTALLGRTRATVMSVIADHPGGTTTQLAEYARISLASASEHATILRNAGLTALLRDGKNARHTATPAGLALLSASANP
ncbi:helix-turn-helix transcriptional regulator [Streptomyces sp. Rer75]|uniref:ArsR/SmtB family transcription factor n=1 Tax=unclassified Streptomyces TaxID=2593676 RepID=UPI0015D046BD|nr:helix-turn-helix transcriptional regulator [Streptomyces sp. Rer75]QLH24224.1 helix-turn-helix transcriptional regulator [Streptomyces sp. Rer75]